MTPYCFENLFMSTKLMKTFSKRNK